jgi:L-threonate 2-dehydrogenase
MPATRSRIGVVGLGSMGFGMAQSLLRAGFEVTGYDIAPETVARFVAEGGHGAASPAEAARDDDASVARMYARDGNETAG